MTAVVVDGQKGKEYRLPTPHEIQMAGEAEKDIAGVFAEIPFGLPESHCPARRHWAFRVPLYGFDQWKKLFTSRQLLALGTFVKWTRAAANELADQGYPPEWEEASLTYLALQIDKVADYNSAWSASGIMAGENDRAHLHPVCACPSPGTSPKCNPFSERRRRRLPERSWTGCRDSSIMH